MIRKATTSDIEVIHHLIKYGAKHGKMLARSKGEIARVIDSFYLWIEKNDIVGCCGLEVYSKKPAEIRSLVVLPGYQKNSIGAKLVKVCIRKAKEQNVYEILAITDKDSFFEKLGFQKCLDNQWPMFLKTKAMCYD